MRSVRALLLSFLTLLCACSSCPAQDDTPAVAAPVPATDASASAATTIPLPSPNPTAPVVLRFAQITDAHLFDAGYRCAGSFVEREYQENLHALEWSIARVNARWNAGDRISFLVFTGDLGMANLATAGVKATNPAPGTDSACVDDDPKNLVGPITQETFELAAAQLGHILDDLPPGVTVYFVPGNNDLDDEDATSMPKRYTLFMDDLIKATHHTVVDLIRGPGTAGPYTLLGLNSAIFKPQSYDINSVTDPAAVSQCGGTRCDEAALVVPGNQPAPDGAATDGKVSDGSAPLMYCDDLKAAGSGPRAAAKTSAIDALVSAMSSGPFLLFTHVPDLQDTFAGRRENAEKRCEYRSSWLLTDAARTTWQTKVMQNKDVVGIFAGHFHSSQLSTYGGPKYNDALGMTGPYTAPTFVTMPLAIRLQWPDYPSVARGMTFFTLRGNTVSPEIELYTGGDSSEGRKSHTLLAAKSLRMLHADPDLTFWLAALLTFALLVILLWMASTLDPKCVFNKTPVNRVQYVLRWFGESAACTLHQFGKLIIEGDTQSYSLSKLQFLLWTIATVYGYTYLYIAHTWVQGLPGLPDVTGSFPWETLLAGGTAVASQISKQAFGTKGGGPLKPHLADLISAGGVIATGRIQFLSWTLVAIVAYLSSFLATDPSTIHLLPEIPTRLLEISGISAGTYLAARSVSSAGPLLTSALFKRPDSAKGDDSTALGYLTILGSALSKSAVLQAFQATHVATVQAAELHLAAASATDADGMPEEQTGIESDAVSGVDGVPIEGFKYDPVFNIKGINPIPGSTDLFPQLRIKILGGPLPAKWTLRLQNPDGKYAEVEVATDAAPPPPVNAAPADTTPVDPSAATPGAPVSPSSPGPTDGTSASAAVDPAPVTPVPAIDPTQASVQNSGQDPAQNPAAPAAVADTPRTRPAADAP